MRYKYSSSSDRLPPDQCTKLIVFEENLKELFKRCPYCGSAVVKINFDYKHSGSLLKVHYACKKGHLRTWHAQPLLKGMAAGNLLIACAVLFSGLTYE